MTQAAENKKLEGNAITVAPVQEKEKNPIDGLRKQMVNQRSEFKLPSHISFDKFQRTVMTACVQNPDLLLADRRSLLLSCVKAATDGLLPDGREAALVIFNNKLKTLDGQEKWVKAVQYMPMTFGILKKVRQSGDVSMVVAHVVYEKDKFEYVLGDDERIEHTPYMGIEDRGPLIAAYAIARLKDGSVQREVMTVQDIEKVRKTSKSGSMTEAETNYEKNKGSKVGDPKGIWKEWYDEMARKTVFRRLAKWLPQSIDKEGQDALFSNDDTMDALDSVTPDAATNEKPLTITEAEAAHQITDQSDQPDLGQMIDEAKDREDKKEKVPVNAAEEKQKPEPKKKEAAQEQEKEKPVSAIVRAIQETKDDGELDAVWNVEFAKEIDDLSKAELAEANAAYSAQMKNFNK